MKIERIGSQPSSKDQADWFTGTARTDPVFQAPGPALVIGASVTLERGTRTEPVPPGRHIRSDQTLIVTAGREWVQRSYTDCQTHIAIQERLDGKARDWMEHVDEEQHRL